MTGKELAKEIRNTKGKISIPMTNPHDVFYVYAEKADLIRWAESFGDENTNMRLSREERGEGYFLEIEY